jgi:uncharacterized protein (TIGR02757 family)
MNLGSFLDSKVTEYNRASFIEGDPICIPHRFSRQQDIEIAGFFAALFAWGNRTTIINKAWELMDRMDRDPYRFCLDHQPSDLKRLLSFKHRTFNATDMLFLVDFLHRHYTQHDSLESAFTKRLKHTDTNMENGLNGFYEAVFDLPDAPDRTRKHIAAPFKQSSCKRLNMYLRWMVRRDEAGVDFGLWRSIRMDQLVIPLDLHVSRVAKKFQLLHRPQADWSAAIELTDQLKQFDAADPVKYDFALFALGVLEKF